MPIPDTMATITDAIIMGIPINNSKYNENFKAVLNSFCVGLDLSYVKFRLNFIRTKLSTIKMIEKKNKGNAAVS